ncbi:HD domain-containing protein [bacterium]|nr:HD domain-containing protein [bacterium]
MAGRLDQILITLGRGISRRRLYFADHPTVRELGDRVVDQLESYLVETGERSFFLGVVEGKLVHQGRALHGPSIMAAPLIRFVEACHAGGLVFGGETTPQEVRDFVAIAATLKDPPASLAEARAMLAREDIRSIGLASEYTDPLLLESEEDRQVWRGRDEGDHDLPSPVLVYQALFDVVTAANSCATTGRTLDIDSARAACEHLIRCTRSNFTDMMQLMQYPDYDSYTVGHSVRVAALAVYVGGRLGMENNELLSLGTAALLHDVGKSRIPEEVLFKPGKLDPQEYAVMQSHARLGAEVLLEHRNATPIDVAAAWGHHLRHDGGGYPTMPDWAVRSPAVGLVQVCDVYEALTAIRPYKAPMSPPGSFERMIGDPGAFDPGLLAAFVGSLGLYPPGSQVRLNDGRLGTVTAPGEDVVLPSVRITHRPDGELLPLDEQEHLDLAQQEADALAIEEIIAEIEAIGSKPESE